MEVFFDGAWKLPAAAYQAGQLAAVEQEASEGAGTGRDGGAAGCTRARCSPGAAAFVSA